MLRFAPLPQSDVYLRIATEICLRSPSSGDPNDVRLGVEPIPSGAGVKAPGLTPFWSAVVHVPANAWSTEGSIPPLIAVSLIFGSRPSDSAPQRMKFAISQTSYVKLR